MGIRLRRFVQGNGPWVGLARVNAGRLPSGHWLLDPAQGGGRIVGEACHYIDLFAFLFDAVPRSVRAERLPGGAGPDDALLTIEYGDGSLGTIAYYSGGHPLASKERIEVHGGGRAAVLDDFRRLDLWQGGRHQSHRSLLRQDKGHRGLWEAFVSAVVHAGSPPIPYEHIFAVSLAAIAARDALASGEAMSVSLPSLP
jgi:predicted dehydrogenase